MRIAKGKEREGEEKPSFLRHLLYREEARTFYVCQLHLSKNLTVKGKYKQSP